VPPRSSSSRHGPSPSQGPSDRIHSPFNSHAHAFALVIFSPSIRIRIRKRDLAYQTFLFTAPDVTRLA
jgi:hypothetical protein